MSDDSQDIERQAVTASPAEHIKNAGIGLMGGPVGFVAAAAKEVIDWFSSIGKGQGGFLASYPQARALLTLFVIDPPLIFSGADVNPLITPDQFWYAIDDGETAVKKLQVFAASGGPMPLAFNEPAYLNNVLQRMLKAPNKADDISGGRLELVQNAADARTLLQVLRSNLPAVQWAKDKLTKFDSSYMPVLRDKLKLVRALAGESTPDIALGEIFEGDVTPTKLQVERANLANRPSMSSDWWSVVGIGAIGMAVAGAVIYHERRRLRLNELHEARMLEAPGTAAFHRVLSNGVIDGELDYPRSGTRASSMRYFTKAFNDARRLGISPTELATTGRYTGQEPEPIQIEITVDGVVRLPDGRHRYITAKNAGASAILARVVCCDEAGNSVDERLTTIKLV